MRIFFREFLGQAWTKADKAERAPHILMMTAHFNHISNLVISEILKKYTLAGLCFITHSIMLNLLP